MLSKSISVACRSGWCGPRCSACWRGGSVARRLNDFYETAPWQTRALLHHQPISGLVLECCSGDQSIAKELRAAGLTVITNDVDRGRKANFHFDAAEPALYAAVYVQHKTLPDWVITNPPYKMPICTTIVENALNHVLRGVAMMVRISFREPTAHINPRGPFLEANPISRALTLPRYSFTGNKKSDTATTEWLIWTAEPTHLPPLLSLYRADERFSLAPLARGR